MLRPPIEPAVISGLLLAYGKNEKVNLTADELAGVRAFAKAIKATQRSEKKMTKIGSDLIQWHCQTNLSGTDEGYWSEAFRPQADATRPGRQNGSV